MSSTKKSDLGPQGASSSKGARRRINFTTDDPHEILNQNRTVAPAFQREKHKKDAARNWDIFYKNSGSRFFKDRHWTEREFVPLSKLQDDDTMSTSKKGKGKIVLEVGCGTGAFVYPLLERTSSVRFAAFDFSPRAVDLVKSNPLYDTARIYAFVHDLVTGADELRQKLMSAPPEFWSTQEVDENGSSMTERALSPPDSAPSVISCIFVLSALPPTKQFDAVRSLVSVLAPGGELIWRDYALYDEAQLRFHALPSKGYATVPSLLSEEPTDDKPDDGERGKPWYRRGDSTMTYFFTTEEIEQMLSDACASLNAQAESASPTDSSSSRKFRMVGEATVVERAMENKAEGWGCTRRFVQGTWKKIELSTDETGSANP